MMGFFVGLSIAIWLSKNLNVEMRRARMMTLTTWGGIFSLVSNPAHLIFVLSQITSLFLFLAYDHDMKPEWIENIAIVCGEDRLKSGGGSLTPAQ